MKVISKIILFCMFLISENAISNDNLTKNQHSDIFKDKKGDYIYKEILKINKYKKNETQDIENNIFIINSALKELINQKEYQYIYSILEEIYQHNDELLKNMELRDTMISYAKQAFINDYECDRKSKFITQVINNGILIPKETYPDGIMLIENYIDTSIKNYESNEECVFKFYSELLKYELIKIIKLKNYSSSDISKITNLLLQKIKNINENKSTDYLISIRGFYLKLLKNNKQEDAIKFLININNTIPSFATDDMVLSSEKYLLDFKYISDELQMNKITLLSKYIGSDLWPFNFSKDAFIKNIINIQFSDQNAKDLYLVITSNINIRFLKNNKNHNESKLLYKKILSINANNTAKSMGDNLYEVFYILIEGFKINAALTMNDLSTASKLHDANIDNALNLIEKNNSNQKISGLSKDLVLVILKPFFHYEMLMNQEDAMKKIVDIAIKSANIDWSQLQNIEYLKKLKITHENSVSNLLIMLKEYYKHTKNFEKLLDIDFAIAYLIPDDYKNTEQYIKRLFQAINDLDAKSGRFYINIFKEDLKNYSQNRIYFIYKDVFNVFEKAIIELELNKINDSNKLAWQRRVFSKVVDDLAISYFLDYEYQSYFERLEFLFMLFDFNKIIERNEEAYIFASMYLDLLSNGTSIIDDKILYNEFQDSRSDQLQIIISFLLKKNYLSDAKSALSIFKQHNFLKFLEKAGEPIRGNDINKFGFNNSIGASIKSKNIQIDLIDQRINREKSSSEILKLQKLKILLKSELRLAYKSSNSVVNKTSNLTRSKKNIAEGNVYVDFFYKDNKLSIVYSDKSIITKFDAEIDALEFSKAIFELSKFNLSSTDNYSIANINFLYSSLILPIESLLIKSNSKNLFIRSNSFITSIPFKLLFSSTNSDLKYLNVLYLGIEGGASDNFLLSEESSLFASTNKFGNLTALKSAELELNYISNIFELNFPITFKTRKFLNNEFTFDKLIHEFSSNSNTLHIATHYNSNRNNGGLLLGTGQIVSPKQIWKSLPISPNRKLIIISACESGLLNDLGESFDDLPNVFLNKGAKFVVSSLWKISDSGTAEFMQLFYAILMISKDPSIALNLTQSSFADGNFNKLYSKYTLDDTFKTKYKHILLNYSHPFYWAGFQLISNN